MKKNDLLALLTKKAKACAPKERRTYDTLLTEIEELLKSFPDDFNFAFLDSVRNCLCSKIPAETNPLEILKSVLLDLKKARENPKESLEKMVGTKETEARTKMDRRKKCGMFTFLTLIVLFAVAAIACAIAVAFVEETNPCYDLLDKSATIFGLLDFALGAGGFVWERISDMHNEAVKTSLHESAVKAQNAGTAEDLDAAVAAFNQKYREHIDKKAESALDATTIRHLVTVIGSNNVFNTVTGVGNEVKTKVQNVYFDSPHA